MSCLQVVLGKTGYMAAKQARAAKLFLLRLPGIFYYSTAALQRNMASMP